MQPISEVLKLSQSQQLTLKEVLETYKHIELSEDEVCEAMIWGKQKKERIVAEIKIKEREAENRKKFTVSTTPGLVDGLMRIRMEKVFPDGFILDEQNAYLYDLLCLYFGNDERFISNAMAAGVKNPTLKKGIMLAGNFGTGKTYMMKLFSKNQRQCFAVKNAKEIATQYKSEGELTLEEYIQITKAAFEDPSVFYQPSIGLCIDDLGTEDLKTNYGDKKNVIGDIIEQRYFNNNCGIYFHGSTNLTAQQLKDYYGERVTSRMREIFNFIEVRGTDRRK